MRKSKKTIPKKINLAAWSKQFDQIPDEVIKRYKYYNNGEWGIYLSPPATFMVYGARELNSLKFDNSFEALRMWGFVFNETERLFRAHQINKKVIATMGDLGAVPVLVLSFPDCVPFYPECTWWTPFFKESTELLDTASKLGMPEATCFSRVVVSAFYKKSYFPKPDLLIASTGASCDDYSCVMQAIEDMSNEVMWIEIPYRKNPDLFLNKPKQQIFEKTKQGLPYPKVMEEYLIREYQRIWQRLFRLTGVNNPHRLAETIKKVNQLRSLVAEIKELNARAAIAPLPALELMTIEFGNLYGYADFDEWLDIIQMMRDMVRQRVEKGIGILKKDAIPIAWVTPSADPYLLNLVEDLGCRVVATEYVINQAMVQIEEDVEPMKALARSFINASLIGTTEQRVETIKEMIANKIIRGVLITNMLGASHCAMETRIMEKLLGDVPVLSIDVPAPSGITQQIRTRIEAFVETIK
jgi:benzoyl-CoA reductase/2-hydroxyglutaryl-CoA dehydratase subunit BcrC/BadD/HgdB